MAEQTESQKVEETLNPNARDKNLTSEEAALETDSSAHTSTESTITNHNAAETSAPASDVDREKSLEYADELFQLGYKAMKENDFSEAAESFSRALEIRVAKFGELAPECVHTYYKYGCALLYKAQEEADPLADVPKKESESQEGSTKDGSIKNSAAESSTTSILSNNEQDVNSNNQDAALDDVSTKEDQEDDKDSDDDDDLAEGDEDDSDLDLAWKMLDIARAIVEKHSSDTMEHVDILSALADVALEREDFETSLSDYKKALSILEQLVVPDDRKIADLNFRICLCLEVNSKPQEAMSYCQKAACVCKERIHRLTNEIKSESITTASESDKSIADKQAEIDTLTGLSSELERKLEDLQQLISNPKSILSEILGLAAAKAGAGKPLSSSQVSSSQMATANSSGGFDSPTVSTAHSNGSAEVTHLGVVGRGVKRTLNATVEEANPTKKPSLETSKDNSDARAS
ncbi:uncharacterized protein LOC129321901 [Prosopis cineraria]|uniref:uncharacterized protein LOC129321901 n=1 Tax=Prosopis cineraria TaxID=364024 RepID=UPI00240FD337|nr:uncharacterized protein LOC129321901 [Prosopis cineraria]